MLAVPALALAGNWPLAAALMIAERTGRAIRKPSTQAMLSFAGDHMGQGWVFGLNEALDQTGATLGPLMVSLVLFLHGDYRQGFALLLIPASADFVHSRHRALFFSPSAGTRKTTPPLAIAGFSYRAYWFRSPWRAAASPPASPISRSWPFTFQKTDAISAEAADVSSSTRSPWPWARSGR